MRDAVKKLTSLASWAVACVFLVILVLVFFINHTNVVRIPLQNGEFNISGKINGQDVVFYIDTGATIVGVGSKMAAKVGLKSLGPSQTYTSGGIVTSEKTTISSIELGGIVVNDVPALIVPSKDPPEGYEQYDTVALGMSFLARLDRFEYRKDEGVLTLEQQRR